MTSLPFGFFKMLSESSRISSTVVLFFCHLRHDDHDLDYVAVLCHDVHEDVSKIEFSQRLRYYLQLNSFLRCHDSTSVMGIMISSSFVFISVQGLNAIQFR